MKINLFTKIDKPTVKECIEYVKGHFNYVSVYQGKVGNPFPLEACNNSPDIVFSYLSPWIIPPKILNKTKLWNINFHPAPPEYPGIGCFNFALYNNEKMYGVTAHHMEEKVDVGKMIAVKRFPIVDSDSAYSLSIKSYSALFLLFIEVVDGIIINKSLPASADTWKRIPYTRKELEKLCKVTLDMKEEEIKRRIRATTYPGMPGTYIEVSGYKFSYNPDR
jgi:methionyl-tRNA formyltransferase